MPGRPGHPSHDPCGCPRCARSSLCDRHLDLDAGLGVVRGDRLHLRVEHRRAGSPSSVSARYWITSFSTCWMKRVDRELLERAAGFDDDHRVVRRSGHGVPSASVGRSMGRQSQDGPVVYGILSDDVCAGLDDEGCPGEPFDTVKVGGDRLDRAMFLMCDVVMIVERRSGATEDRAVATRARPGKPDRGRPRCRVASTTPPGDPNVHQPAATPDQAFEVELLARRRVAAVRPFSRASSTGRRRREGGAPARKSSNRGLNRRLRALRRSWIVRTSFPCRPWCRANTTRSCAVVVIGEGALDDAGVPRQIFALAFSS